MFFRKLEQGIYIDERCQRIIWLPEGWFVPKTDDAVVEKMMEEIERKLCNREVSNCLIGEKTIIPGKK